MPTTTQVDLAVIGSGPAGQKAAIQAAKLGRKAVIIEKSDRLGGAALKAGTLPSKAAREAALQLTGLARAGFLAPAKPVIRQEVSLEEFMRVAGRVILAQLAVVTDALARNGIDIIYGHARFADPHTLVVDATDTGGNTETVTVRAEKIVIATGTRAAMPENVPFCDTCIVSSDTLRTLKRIPKSMIVVGGGVIGTEFACILATLGARVTLVEGRSELLGFVDQEILEAFQTELRRMGITIRLGEKVKSIEKLPPDEGRAEPTVQATLESGKTLRADTLLYAVGRQGTLKDMGLETIGLAYDARERLKVNENYQTSIPHIYAAGDVIGFPSLASAAMEQGRLAACHALGAAAQSLPHLLPYGIYAIPEISMVGKTEKELTDAGIPYESGVAQYSELARGELLGDNTGMLKLLIHQKDRTILGVHCMGTGATELIHIGQMIMAFNGSVDVVVNTVFNYPTLAEAYKVAAFNGINKIELR